MGINELQENLHQVIFLSFGNLSTCLLKVHYHLVVSNLTYLKAGLN